MLCQRCHKNIASIRYAEVVDGQVREQHICAQCQAALNEQDLPGFEFIGPPDVGARNSGKEVLREAVRRQKACTSCGAPLSEIVDSLRVGCSHCYQVFGSEIESILEVIQQGMRHKGKAVRVDDARNRLRADLQNKRTLLRRVLEAEQYEEAARLRDEIRTLETGLFVSESGAD